MDFWLFLVILLLFPGKVCRDAGGRLSGYLPAWLVCIEYGYAKLTTPAPTPTPVPALPTKE